MANMEDYIRWRGDLSFEQAPFNEVDNIILNEIGYVEWDQILPELGSEKEITLARACKLFFKMHDIKELEKHAKFIWYAPFLMRAAASSKRFGNLIIKNYKSVIDLEQETQFCACTWDLGDGTIYVMFKGTDDSLVGWKEDFNMSFIRPVPGQKMAVEYLEQVGTHIRKKIRVGGHSKGGNLAVYAAVMAKETVQKKIEIVYDNDGPGFDREMIMSQSYQKMKPLMHTITPHHSLVGMLLEHDEEYHVVKSDQISVMQHDAMSWQVMGAEFEREPEGLSKASLAMNEALSNWINGLEERERKEFVNTLFQILMASGAETLSEMQAEKFLAAGASLKTYARLSKDEKKMMRRIFWTLTGEFNHSVNQSIFKASMPKLPELKIEGFGRRKTTTE